MKKVKAVKGSVIAFIKRQNYPNLIYTLAMFLFVIPVISETIWDIAIKKFAPIDIHRISLFLFFNFAVINKWVVDHYRDMFDEAMKIAKMQDLQLQSVKKIMETGSIEKFVERINKSVNKEDETLKN